MGQDGQVIAVDNALFDAEAREYAAGLLDRLADGRTVTLGDFPDAGQYAVPTNTEIVAEVFRDIADIIRGGVNIVPRQR